MLTLSNLGGILESGSTDTVLKFNSSNLIDGSVEVASMIHSRHYQACSVFKSELHEGRMMAIVAGRIESGEASAEIWDFTKEGTTWQKSKILFRLNILF